MQEGYAYIYKGIIKGHAYHHFKLQDVTKKLPGEVF